MKRNKAARCASLILRSALIYMMVDLPVQLTGFLSFGSFIGIKNFLPSTLGLLFGPWGAIGSGIGCAAGGLMMHTAANEILLEVICCLIMGIGMWIVWHLGSTTHRIHFKRLINYAKYAGLLLGLSAICGGVSFLLVNGGAFGTILAGYTATGLLIGIPVNILFNGVLCVDPVLPPWYSVEYPVQGVLHSDPQSLSAFTEAIEEFGFERRINMKRLFEIQSCIEELYIRIQAARPDEEIHVVLNSDDTLSVRLRYGGKRYNPLRIGKDEDELDIMGLKLIKHRALRAAYSFKNGENRILIVI